MIITFNAQTQYVERVKHAMEILFGHGIKKFHHVNGHYILVVETEYEEEVVEDKISLFNYADVIAYDADKDDDYILEYFDMPCTE